MNWLAQNWVWIVVGIALIWMVRRGGMAGCGMGHSGHGSDQGKDTASAQRPAEPAGKALGAGERGAAAQEPRKHRHYGC